VTQMVTFGGALALKEPESACWVAPGFRARSALQLFEQTGEHRGRDSNMDLGLVG